MASLRTICSPPAPSCAVESLAAAGAASAVISASTTADLMRRSPIVARPSLSQRPSVGEPVSPHQHVPELPGIALVDALGEEAGPVGERRPVGIIALDRAEIGPLHRETAAEVHLVGFDDAGGWILQRPDHA